MNDGIEKSWRCPTCLVDVGILLQSEHRASLEHILFEKKSRASVTSPSKLMTSSKAIFVKERLNNTSEEMVDVLIVDTPVGLRFPSEHKKNNLTKLSPSTIGPARVPATVPVGSLTRPLPKHISTLANGQSNPWTHFASRLSSSKFYHCNICQLDFKDREYFERHIVGRFHNIKSNAISDTPLPTTPVLTDDTKSSSLSKWLGKQNPCVVLRKWSSYYEFHVSYTDTNNGSSRCRRFKCIIVTTQNGKELSKVSVKTETTRANTRKKAALKTLEYLVEHQFCQI